VFSDLEKSCVIAFFEWLEEFVDSTLAVWFPFVGVQVSIGEELDREREASVLGKI
jgi:hypothetical protein